MTQAVLYTAVGRLLHTVMFGRLGKLHPAVGYTASALQAGGFVLWYHDTIGVESLVV